MNEEKDTLLEFPCAFPIKVMGRATDAFEEEVIRIFRAHVPDLNKQAVTRRHSSKENYTALTVTITATSKSQLDNIYRELTASELVLMAL